MIVKRSSACARWASERDVSGDGASAITDYLPLTDGSRYDDLSESIPDTTPNYQEITTAIGSCPIWGKSELMGYFDSIRTHEV